MSTICEILPGGTILLGAKVSCDGFSWSRPTRVITHVHDDHLREFEVSLGYQEPILMLPATRDLVYAIKGPQSLRFRRNLVAIDAGRTFTVGSEEVTLFPANHILGSAQLLVETAEGERLGYTGDFGWPIDVLPGLDELVLDATYGNPDYVRTYREEDIVIELIELVRQLLSQGKRICIKAVTGRLQYVMQILQSALRVPFVAGKKQCSVAAVYAAYGCFTEPIFDKNGEEARKIIKEKVPYVAFHHLRERLPETDFDVFILVSAYMVPRERPLVELGARTYRVALTDHADFAQTLEYVEKAAPKLVITDNSRGGDAQTLAEELRARLGVRAVVGGYPPK